VGRIRVSPTMTTTVTVADDDTGRDGRVGRSTYIDALTVAGRLETRKLRPSERTYTAASEPSRRSVRVYSREILSSF